MSAPHDPGMGRVLLQPNQSRLTAPKPELRGKPGTRGCSSIVTPRAYACAAAAAGLLWLSYFPVAWGWLGWVALTPLLALVRMNLTTRRLLHAAWVGGLLFFFPVLQWLRVADLRMYATWISLALYCSLFFPAGIWLIRRLDRGTGIPLVLTAPLVWTGLEYVRAHALTGFAWYYLGHTQHDFLPVIQIADLGGAYAVTFIVAAVNALVLEWLCCFRGFRGLLGIADPMTPTRIKPLSVATTMVVAGLVAMLVYGYWRLAQNQFPPGPRVALLQGNLDQRIKNQASEAEGAEAAQTIWQHFVALCDKAAAQQPRPDVIVWPETAWPYGWIESPPGQPNDDCKKMTQWFANRWHAPNLVGVNSSIEDGPRKRLYNSAIWIDANGQSGARYDKMHRVPFGEFVPFRDWIPLMNWFAPYDFDYSIESGEDFTRFPIGSSRFGVLICYEDTDPYLARKYVGAEPKVNFLVNISNDGWFDGTAEHEEHLAICRFRAVECRRAVARAVNMGVSAIVDGNGRVLKPQPVDKDHAALSNGVWETQADALPVSQWGRFKKVDGVFVGAVPIDSRTSLYAAWGDWLPQICWLIIAASWLWTWFRPGVQLRAE